MECTLDQRAEYIYNPIKFQLSYLCPNVVSIRITEKRLLADWSYRPARAYCYWSADFILAPCFAPQTMYQCKILLNKRRRFNLLQWYQRLSIREHHLAMRHLNQQHRRASLPHQRFQWRACCYLGARSAFALCIVPWARCRSPAHITVVSQCKDAEEKSENHLFAVGVSSRQAHSAAPERRLVELHIHGSEWKHCLDRVKRRWAAFSLVVRACWFICGMQVLLQEKAATHAWNQVAMDG